MNFFFCINSNVDKQFLFIVSLCRFDSVLHILPAFIWVHFYKLSVNYFSEISLLFLWHFFLLLRSFLFQFFPTIKFIHGFIMSLNSNEKFFCFSRLKLEKLTISILLSCVSIYFLTKCNERILNEKNICQLNKAVLIIKKNFFIEFSNSISLCCI